MKIHLFLITTYIFSHSILAFAKDQSYEFQSHQSILSAAETYLNEIIKEPSETITIELTPPDHRLRLNRCDDDLEVFSPPGADLLGKTTVGVRCESATPWTLYVSAKIISIQPVVVALKDLSRGAAISSGDITVVERDTSSLLRGYYNATTELVGRTLRRSIRRDQPITPNSLVVEKTVSRGQSVTILAGNKNIQVRMKGKALQNGNPGDLIPVLNITSKIKLQARIISGGTVRID